MDGTVSIKELVDIMKKRLSLIFIITLLTTTVSGVITYFILTPIYSSSTQFIVNHSPEEESGSIKYDEIQANLQLINTYTGIIKSPVVLDKVIKNLKITDTVLELNSQIKVSSDKDSQLVVVTVENKDPNLSYRIANETVNIFKQEAEKIMKVKDVSVLAVAEIPTESVKPKVYINIFGGLIIGMVIGFVFSFLLEYLDSTIKSEQDIGRDVTLLGSIMIIEQGIELNLMTKNVKKKVKTDGGGIIK